MWIVILTGLFLLGMGFYYLNANPDDLWERQDRGFRARGIVNRERTPEWERSQTSSGYMCLVVGLTMVIGGLILSVAIARQSDVRTSGERFYIDGREVSRGEAAAMGFPPAQR